MNTQHKILAWAISSLLLGLGVTNTANAVLTTSIPSSALSSNGKQVTICHFPPGNPANYQVITISTNALNTHISHHDDVFANKGVCPAIPINWIHLGSFSTSTGKPTAISTTSCKPPSDIVNKVLNLLPEGRALANNSTLLTDDSKANIFLTKSANINVAFVTEGAGYTNALGFFSFAKTDLATLDKSKIQEKIMFPNFSLKNSGGDLSFGDAVNIGTFTAGTGIGFTLVSNGWKSGAVDPNRTTNQIFRTVKGMNPEPNPSSQQFHTVLLSDPDSKMLILGIEDLNRNNSAYNDYGYGTDNDFNDAVLAVCVDPYDAIEGVTNINTVTTGTPTTPTTTPPVTTAPAEATITGVTGRQSWSERNVAPATQSNTTGGGASVAPAQ